MTEPPIPTSAIEGLFPHLEPARSRQIEELVSYHTYPAGHLFFSPSERGEHLFILHSGRVRLYKLSAEGRALTLAVLEPVTLFGEMSLVGKWTHDSFAEAMTECQAGVIRCDDLRKLLQQSPQVSLAFMELMGQRLRETENKLTDIAFKSVPQRLATVLLSLAEAAGTSASVVRYTHQQLADMIGSYRETVTKAIGEFRESGFIQVDNEAIHLINVEKLHQLANR